MGVDRPLPQRYERQMIQRVFMFMGGDSHPEDRHVEAALRERLSCPRTLFLGHDDVARGGSIDVETRTSWYREAMRSLPAGARVTLIGRSSAARAATMIAAEEPEADLRAVGIAYPFRRPNGPDEPARYAHLAQLRQPTLILQGRTDPYGGGEEIAGRYPLSNHVRVVGVETGHHFALSSAQWDEVAAVIEDYAGSDQLRPRVAASTTPAEAKARHSSSAIRRV